MTQHVILAYGRETELWRATFAVLSFWTWYSGDRAAVQTVVFTDKPDFFAPYFADLPVAYHLLTPEQLHAMRGPQQYLHRIKIGIIDQVFQHYPGSDLLFCDSDTFFVAPATDLLQQLRPGTSLLHLREYTVTDAIPIYASYKPAHQDEHPRRLIKLIESQTFRVDSEERRFTKDQYIWNSGVLGLTQDIASLMPDVFALNDAFYAGSEWVITEQVAFAMALQCRTELLPSNKQVLHYWGKPQKALMDGLLTILNDDRFRAAALPARLAQVKQLTQKWQRAIERDKVREEALYAIAHESSLINKAKCVVKALAASPFDGGFAKQMFAAFSASSSSQ